VSESAVTAGSTDRWYSLFGWGVAALLFSFVLSNVAILAGALPALILEFGQPREIGIAINAVALAVMIVVYSVALVASLRFAMRRLQAAWTVWVGLLAFPALWGLLMLTSPAYAATPVVVTLVGVVVAWVVLGRRRTEA